MTDGLYVDGRRPKSKKAVREAIADDPGRVEVENTSLYPGGFSGPVADLPKGKRVTFVGPDPYTSRTFYGTITVGENGDGTKRFVVK